MPIQDSRNCANFLNYCRRVPLSLNAYTAEDVPRRPGSGAANRLSRKMTDAPDSHRRMIEKVVEDLLEGMKDSVSMR